MFFNCSWIFISKIAGYPGDAILTGTVDSRARGQVLRYQMQMQSFNIFFGIKLGIIVLRQQTTHPPLYDAHTCTCHIANMVFHHYKTWERKLVSVCFLKKLERKTKTRNRWEKVSKRRVSSHYKEGEAPVEFASTVEERYLQFFISAEILPTLKLLRQWKYYF